MSIFQDCPALRMLAPKNLLAVQASGSRQVSCLGTDEAAAKKIVIEANSRLVERQMAQLIKVRDEISREYNKGISEAAWVDKYLAIQAERLESGEIHFNTHKQKLVPLKAFVSNVDMKSIETITVREITDLLDHYTERDKLA